MPGDYQDVFSALDSGLVPGEEAKLKKDASNYQDVFDQVDAMSADNVRSAMTNAEGKSPAEHAKKLKLSKQTGLSPSTLSVNQPAVENRVKTDSIDYQSMVADSPAVTRWLSKPDNAIIAQNDVKNLTALEHILNVFRASVDQAVADVEKTGAQMADLYGALSVGEKKLGFNVSDTTIQRFGTIASGYRSDALIHDKVVSDIEKSRAGLSRVPRVALSGLQSLFPSLVAVGTAIALRSPVAGLVTFGLPVFGNAAQNALNQGLDPLSSAVHGARQAGIEVLSESLGFKPLMNLAKGKGKVVETLFEFLGKELIGEEINTIAGNFESWLNLPSNANKTFKDFITAIPSNAIDTFIATVAGAGATGSIVAGTRAVVAKGIGAIHERSYKKAEAAAFDVKKSDNGQQTINAINHYAGQSETKKIDPEAFRDAVNNIDSESEVVLDSEKVDEFLQTKTPEEMDSDPLLQTLQKKISDTGAGEDISMSVADFATDVAGSAHYDELRPHVKIGFDTATPFRHDESVNSFRDYMNANSEVAKENVSKYVESQKIFAQVQDQVFDTGRMSQTDAAVVSQVVVNAAVAESVSTGVSVEEVYKSWGLKIQGPQTGAAAENAQRATAFDQNTLEDILKEFDALGFDAGSSKLDSIMKVPPVKRQGRLLAVTGLDKDASWTSDRLNRVIDDHQELDGQSSSARIAFVNPADFVNATHSDPQVISDQTRKLDVGKLQKEPGTPFLYIDGDEIVGHEGRHRMAALAAAGVGRVPIQVISLEFSAADTIDENRPMSLKGQFFETGTGADLNIAESYLAVSSNTQLIESKMGKGDVFFQGATRPVVSKDEELLSVIRSLGGIKQSLARDITGENNTVKTGTGSLFRKSGSNLDELASLLQPMGFNLDLNSFDGGVSQLSQMVADSINGAQNLTAVGQNQMEDQRQYDLAATDANSPFQDPSILPGYGEPFDQVILENIDGQVWFEVAPDPHSDEAARWNELTLKERKQVSDSILRQFAPAILGTLGLEGSVVDQYGGWEGQPNPSTALVLKDQQQVQKVMQSFGHVFDQEGMYGVASEPFAGSVAAEMITIEYPDTFTEEQVNDLYQELWKIKKEDGKGRIQGFSAHDGVFMTVNNEDESGLTTDDLIDSIDVMLSNTEYGGLTLRKSAVYAVYELKEENNYGFEYNRSHENGGTTSSLASFEQGSVDRIRRTALTSRSAEVESIIGRRRTASVRAETVLAREEDGSLHGLPRFRGARHSQEVENVAREYMERAGMPYLPLISYAPLNEHRASLIADEYAAMENNPEDPEVAAAYQAMINETVAQYETILKSGIEVEFVPEGVEFPYEKNPRLATEDITENNHIWVYSSREGFGSDEEFNNDKNPLLAETKFKISGQVALANDLFRVVHDYFGHVKEGVGFRADGEDNAWRVHSTMFTPLARRAMTSETRGQNSWLNYGPHGKANRKAKGADTRFADQKVGLLPEWVTTEGAFDNTILDTLFEQRNALGFYSAVTKSILTMNIPGFKPSKKNPDGEARGADIWAKLKSSGMKKEELEIIGIEEFLTMTPDTKFTREEVADFVKENGVNMVEVTSEGQSNEENIVWNEEVDEDPSNWEYRTEESLFDYDNSTYQDIIDNSSYALSELTFFDIVENFIDGASREDLPLAAQAALNELTNIDGMESGEIVNLSDEATHALMDAMIPVVRDEVELVFDEQAKEEYFDNPYVNVTDSKDNVRVFGNDEVGFTVQGSNGRHIADGIYSVEEAKIQAMDYLTENDFPGGSGGAQWGEYVMEGDHENYRENKLTLPDLPDFLFDDHFPERNILAFQRVDDRDLFTGEDETITPDEQVTFTVAVIDNPVKNAVVKRLLQIVDSNGDEIYSNDVDSFSDTTEQAAIDRLTEKITNDSSLSIRGYQANGDGTLTKRGHRVENAPKRTYFIDEFQSDWHQQGRKFGYATGADVSAASSLAASEEAIAQTMFNALDESDDPKIKAALLKLSGLTGHTPIQTVKSALRNTTHDKVVRKVVFEVITSLPELVAASHHIENMVAAERVIKAENDIPDVPFKGDAWLALGIKRAVMDAIDNGYEAVAWPNSEVLVDRWSEQYRELYENQYDKKMPSIARKLTGITPKLLDADGSDFSGDLGYHIIPITDELRKRYSADGFALFQDIRGFYDPEQTLIRLTEASNLSTFLHEFGHFMLDRQQKTKGPMIKEINKWFERNKESLVKESIAQIKHLIKKHQKAIDSGEGNNQFLKAKIATLESTLKRGISVGDISFYLKFGSSGSIGADEGIQHATHEQFARGWEAYLMEGKSPSLEMNNIFRTMVRWMANIYNSIKDLGVTLDDDIRKVFDRLVATEEQIDAAEARARLQPLFTDAVSAGMTEEQWAKYQAKTKAPADKAAETIRDKLIREFRSRTNKWWKQELALTIDDEKEKLLNEPLYKSIVTLKTGDIKFDRGELKDKYGVKDKRGRLIVPPKLRGMTAAGGEGAPLDEVAGIFGFESGDKMINDILAAPTLTEQSKTNAEAAMIREHGDMLNDGTIEQLADDALENEERADLILAELKHLLKGTRQAVVDRRIIKQLAEQKIGEIPFSKNNPARYRAAEIKSAQEAATALATGDKQKAAVAKMQQLTNHYLAMASTEAKNDTLKIVTRVARYRKKKVREAIIRAGDGYMEQIDKILSRFEFRKSATLKAVDKVNQSLAEFIAARQDDGANIVLDPAVVDETFVTHWKNVPFTSLQGINDSLKNLEHVARYANKMKLDGEELDFKELAAKFVAHIEKQEAKYPRKDTAGIESDVENKSSATLFLRWSMSHMTKIPLLTSWLDNGERVGMSHDLIMQPFTDALHNKYELHRSATLPVMQALAGRSKEDLKRHNTMIFIPELNQSIRGDQVLAVALNTGNEGNLKKMLLGEGWAKDDTEVSIDNPKLQAILAHLTKSDAELIQLIWDQMDTLYPLLAEVHQRTSGVAPMKIVATPVTLAGVELQGGYYPVVYSRARSHNAEKNAERREAEVESMFDRSGRVQQSVTAGATNERTDFKDKIQLSLDVIPNHFEEVVHFITHHDAVAKVNRLISHPDVANAITGVLGEDEYKLLKPWLNDIAKDGRESGAKNFIEWAFQKLRLGTTLGIMGFKASTGIMQLLGLTTTAGELGAGRTMKAVMHVVGRAKYLKAVRRIMGSTDDIESAWEFAVSRSKVMSHRADTMDREINAAVKILKGKQGLVVGKLPAVQEASMKHIALIQTYMVDLPTWHAAYDKELELSGDPDKAARHADWAVENLQGSGAVKDMSAIMRNQSKVFTTLVMFMTFFSSLWNLTRDTGRIVGSAPVTTIAAKAAFFFVLPVILEALLRGDFGDGDDEEEQLQAMLLKIALYPTTSVPFVRDLANATGVYQYNFSPVTSTLTKGIEGSKSLFKAATSDDKEATRSQIKNATKVVGIVFGIPGTSQVWATGEHLADVISEGEDLTLRELIYGPKRK